MTTDLRTRTIVDNHCPFTGVQFSEALTGGGSFTGSFKAGWPSWTDTVSNDLMQRVIWPLRHGKPVGAYVFSKMGPYDPAVDVKVPIQAIHLGSVLARRVIKDTLSFSGVDQNNILRDLIRYAIGGTTVYSSPVVNASYDPKNIPWITLDSTLSGVLRDRLETPGNTDDGYPASARKIVDTCLRQLSQLDGGVEFRWLYGLDSSGFPFMKLDTGGATNNHWVGRPRGSVPTLVFEHPSATVASASYGADGEKIVTRAHVLGAEREGSRPIGEATFTAPIGGSGALLDEGYPLLESVWSESSVQEQATLDAKAQGRLGAAADAWSLTLNGWLDPQFTTYGLGDFVVLRVLRADGVQLPDRDLRITGWSVQIDDTGVQEKVTPTLEAW